MWDDKQVNAKALAELQSMEESIVHVSLERSRLETFEIGTSEVCSSYSTHRPPNVSGTDAPIDTTILTPHLDVTGPNARVVATPTDPRD